MLSLLSVLLLSNINGASSPKIALSSLHTRPSLGLESSADGLDAQKQYLPGKSDAVK